MNAVKVVDAFRAYFDGTDLFEGLGLRALEETYNWPIPAHAYVPPMDEGWSTYRKNVALKFHLQKMWAQPDADLAGIASWIVVEWGRIGANRA